MPRKIQFSSDDIVDAAVDLIEKQGIERFSVRNIAKEMKASTQPIYSCFENSEELLEAAKLEIQKRLLAYTRRKFTDKLFRNMGIGFTHYARDYPRLFSAFFQKGEHNKVFIESFLQKLRIALDSDLRFVDLSAKSKDRLLDKMWIFTFGYANLIIQGIVKETTDKDIENMIVEVGLAVIKDTIAQEKNKNVK